MNLSSTELSLLEVAILFQFANGKTSDEILKELSEELPKVDEQELKLLIKRKELIWNSPSQKPKPKPQKTDKYNCLYDYVMKNLGTDRIKFETKVSEEEFRTYLYNFPRKYESNNFMGWCDFYDFTDKKNEEAHWNYCIARHYYDYGADDYYLPTIPKE
jgi:hypothetical protein